MGTGTGLWHLVCIDDISLNENLETQVKAIKPIMLSIQTYNYSTQKFSIAPAPIMASLPYQLANVLGPHW